MPTTAFGSKTLLISRLMLGSLLGILLLGALIFERGEQPLVAGEAGPLMQAMSLAEDFDLAYSRADFDRFLIAHRANPPDLELVSGSEGRRISFADPFPQAFWSAPWIALLPSNGFAVANVLLLALAAAFTTRALEKRIGPLAALGVVALIAGSAIFRYVYLATNDLFLLCLAAIAFAFLDDARRPRSAWIAGALLAVCFATETLTGVLLLAALVHKPFSTNEDEVPPRVDRGAVLLGAGMCTILIVAVQWWSSGGLHFFGTERFRFTPETGFPLVDFTTPEWGSMLHRLQALYWDGAPRFSWGVDLGLWSWNALDLLFGRTIGLLPYFPFLLVLFLGALRFRGLAIATLLWAIGVIVLHPFNLHGGEGAVANRLFLPIYGALWITLGTAWQVGQAGRENAKKWNLAASAATALSVLLAGLFLWRLWFAPWAPLMEPKRGASWVTPLAWNILPHETAQRRLPKAQDAELGGMRVRLNTAGAWVETLRDRLMIDGNEFVEMVIASPEPLDLLRLELDGEDAPAEIEVLAGALDERLLLAAGGVGFRLQPAAERRHPLWWTPQPQWIYRIAFRLPEASQPVPAKLFGERIAD